MEREDEGMKAGMKEKHRAAATTGTGAPSVPPGAKGMGTAQG